MEVSKDIQNVQPLPDNFRRGLEALVLSYRGYEHDLVEAYAALQTGNKKDFLALFRKLKSKQIADEHYKETRRSAKWISKELHYPGNEDDKRKLQKFFVENPPTEQNVKLFKEQIEGLRNKNATFRGDRSHPNIVALLKLELSYPGCEQDVQEALKVHYSRPLTQFPNTLHSLQMKQALFNGDRSHKRLVQLDGLKDELSYPRWERDFDAAEDWHAHNAESRENEILFHDIVEGMLEKQAIYLEWVLERRQPREMPAELNANRSQQRQERETISSFDNYYVTERVTEEKKRLTTQQTDEEREPTHDCKRS